jgi:hypothetical protein
LGPLIVARQLRLILQTLKNIDSYGRPQLPAAPAINANGRLRIPVVPVKGMFDSLLFPRFQAHAWLKPDIDPENLFIPLPDERAERKVALVLGAGNISAIPAADALGKIFQDGQVVLLKMHPVNAYLSPILQSVFQPLIQRGYLKIIDGGAAVGKAAIAHPLIDNVHITGSIDTHDEIVWGGTENERNARLAANTPLLRKPITSELGNVTPWIVVPGRYSPRQLAFQAENVAASIITNAGFSCATTRVLITWKHWPQRQQFLQLIHDVFRDTPRRVAFYPGAIERYRQLCNDATESDDGTLPWTLVDVDPERSSPLLSKESFVCVCAHVSLPGTDPADFLAQATDFVNDQLWGTLCAALTIPSEARRDGDLAVRLEECLDRLRYGCVSINQWPGLMFGLVSPPWGGHPTGTLADAQSGLGWVHNTYRLRGVEKTVMEGPLTIFPKPLWFPRHADPEPVAWAALQLYRRSSVARLPALAGHALRGHLKS